MRLGLVVVTVALTLGACEPEEELIADPRAPGAAGTVAVDPAVDLAGYTTLELRGFPAVAAATAGEEWRDLPAATWPLRAESIPLDGLALPVDFLLGGDGIGATDAPRFRVVAWLARTPGTEAPAPGAPWGTTTVELQECGFACEGVCYCSVTDGASVVLAP
jgi:hypothetical protein